jgi:protein-disulfide isomerase
MPVLQDVHDSSDLTIRREYIDNGKVRLAFVNFPINSHQNAIPAAEYAMCAAGQDKFWQMHDALFAAQEKWAALPEPGPASRTGCRIGRRRRDRAALVRLRTQDATAHRSRPGKGLPRRVRATPSFFIGNQLLEGVQPAEELRKALDAALASAGSK